MKLRNRQTGGLANILGEQEFFRVYTDAGWADYGSLAELNEEWEDAPVEPLIKDEKIRKAVRAWAEAENCTSEMNIYYTLNRREKYITFHNPQTGSELQLCEFDSPVFQEMREYTIDELCGEEEE